MDLVLVVVVAVVGRMNQRSFEVGFQGRLLCCRFGVVSFFLSSVIRPWRL